MFRSLQTRLLVLLILFSVTPALVLGASLGLYSANAARERVQDTLTAVITLKESQVNKWVDDLQASLDNEIRRDTDTQRLPILINEDSASSFVFRTAYNEQIRLFNTTITTRGNFEEIFLMDLQGRVVASTNPTQEGRSYAGYEIFRIGRESAYIAAPAYDITVDQITVRLAQPVIDSNGETIGVLAARANIRQLNEIMQERTGFGQTGETYLVAKNLTLLTQTRLADFRIGEDYVRTSGAELAIYGEQGGSANYLNYTGTPVIGTFRWLPKLEVALLAEQSQAEAYFSANLITNITVAALVVSITLAIIAAYLVSNNLTQPIIRLTQAAQRISGASGEIDSGRIRTGEDAGTSRPGLSPITSTSDELPLSLQIDTARVDEIGTLGSAFQAMTLQLRQLIQSLESRVEERTRQLQARSDQLQAAAEVSRTVATILDTSQLIQQVVELIQQRYELYYVGLFLTDAAREWAVLQAGTGQAGQAMLARQHRIKIGAGMVGWSIANSQARVALEAGEDAVRLATADLPETRSEAAIPLRSRGQVLGAITVQSRLPNAFDRETISVFQTMADQIAVAIDNARLFAESQRAIESVQQAYGRMSHQAWLERISSRPIAYKRDQIGLVRIDAIQEKSDQETQTSGQLSLPLKARGQVIGYMHIQRAATNANTTQPNATSPVPQWSQEEIALLETILDQVGESLDSARLFEETQQQAQRERLVGEITTNMRSTLDIDNVLQTAAREMLNVLDLAEVEVRLSSASQSEKAIKNEAGQESNGTAWQGWEESYG